MKIRLKNPFFIKWEISEMDRADLKKQLSRLVLKKFKENG